MLNKDLFYRDPTNPDNAIPNEGVAKVGMPENPEEWETLRFELEHFVCEGQYEAGLDRILAGYLAHMDQPMQPAVWVSGFYGSGKSHFLKVLQNLWNNVEFPGGASARGITQVTERVSLQLRELDTVAKRSGGLWAAAGTLGAGPSGSVRLSFLGILFGAAGLPTNYAAAKLVIWLKQEGIEQKVRDHLARVDRVLEHELWHMGVSTYLADALLDAVPGFAATPADALKQLSAAYPQVDDVDNDEFCDTLRDVLLIQAEAQGKPGKLPCTLIIIDELQQYIGDDVEKADKVLRIVEAVVAKFGSQVLFVASGQSSMGATPQLLRLQDRFTGRVEFTDTDVDRVVRQVVLRKKPDKVALLEEHLTQVSGEIDRQLRGTRIGPTPEDAQVIVQDYPLLPARRRFWEHVLRAVDRAGSSGQLRTQLRSVQEAARYVGDMPMGTVVPADFIYARQVHGMLYSGVLSKELHELIEGLKDGLSSDGGLKHRIAALVFLIDQVKGANRDLGLRATASTLADLLVMDLNESSSALRTEVERALEALSTDGTLDLTPDGEYSLRDEISKEWHQYYTTCFNRIKDEAAVIQDVRVEKLKEALASKVGNLSIVQGEAKVPRRGQFWYGEEPPKLDTGFIPVWIRDEWSVGSLKAAEDDAVSRGPEDPVVHVLIPKNDTAALKEAIAAFRAAQQTLDAKADAAATEEGAAARAGMQSRRDGAEERVRVLIAGVLDKARVVLSGGSEVCENDLRTSITAALRAAAQRMYPKFDIAAGNWGLVVQRASQGSASALEAVDHFGAAKDQRVCSEVIKHLQAGASTGKDVLQHFTARPFGWPEDAIKGALMVLARSGDLKVQSNGQDVPLTQLTQDRLTKFVFSVEQQPFTTAQRLELRTFLSEVEHPCKPNEEAEGLAAFIADLLALGQHAGGRAPLPPVPDLQPVRALESLSGNERLAKAWEERDALKALWTSWKVTAAEVTRRSAEWERLERLVGKCASLPEAGEARAQMDGVIAARSLLSDPDPIRPVATGLVEAARRAIAAYHEEYKTARQNGLDDLQSVEEYAALPKEIWQRIVRECGLGPLPELVLSTEAEVLEELERTPLDRWQDRIEGMKGRIEKARRLLAQAAQPETPLSPYTPPAKRLTSVEDVDSYLSEMRTALVKVIESGSHVIIQR